MSICTSTSSVFSIQNQCGRKAAPKKAISAICKAATPQKGIGHVVTALLLIILSSIGNSAFGATRYAITTVTAPTCPTLSYCQGVSAASATITAAGTGCTATSGSANTITWAFYLDGSATSFAGSTFTAAGVYSQTGTIPAATMAGLAVGTHTVVAKWTNGTANCGSTTTLVSANMTFSVVASPTAISGTTSICSSGTNTLTSTPTGGTWTSSAPTVASVVSTTGAVTYITNGTTTITYTLSDGCTAVTTFTDAATPAAIGGTASMCLAPVTVTTVMAESWESGVPSSTTAVDGWRASSAVACCSGTGLFSQQTAAAAIEPTVSAAENGTYFLEYNSFAIASGSYYLYSPVFSMANRTTGTVTFWIYRDETAYTGSVYSAEGFTLMVNTSLSATGATTLGFVPRAGNDTISGSYITGTSAPGATGWYQYTCTIPASFNGGATNYLIFQATAQDGDNTYLDNIVLTAVGPTPATLTDAVAGGTWTSGTPAVATVAGGIVSPLTQGTTLISYTNSCGTQTVTATVTGVPAAITGAGTMCYGATTTLGNTTTNGTWTSSATGVATINSSTGLIGAAGAGTTTITYSTGCGTAATATVTVNNPGTISGATTVCGASTITLSSTGSGGAWSASNTNASVSTGGVVTGNAGGSVTISYTSGSCYATYPITVTAPAAITGSNYVCTTGTTTLSDATASGTWSSSNPSVASIDPVSGAVQGITAGATTISYMVSGCSALFSFTDAAAPPAITGATGICAPNANLSISESFESGVPGSFSIVGTASYWLQANGSTAVSPATGAAESGTYQAEFNSYSLSAVGSSLCSPAFSMVGMHGGQMTFWLYRDMTAYTGATYSTEGISVYVNTTNATTGGSPTLLGFVPRRGNAAATSAGGYLTPLAAPGASGWYQYTCTIPASYTGATNYVLLYGYAEAGDNIYVDNVNITATGTPNSTTLADAGVPSGTWSSTTPSVATISASGVVSGLAIGTTTINYTTVCGVIGQTEYVLGVPAAITGANTIAVGSTETVADATANGTWTSSATGIATVNPSTGLLGGIGSGSTIVTYSTGCGTATTATVNVTLPCSGTPTAGTAAASPTSGNATTTIALTNTGYTVAGGIGFQWYSSLNGTTYSSISGATNATYSVAGISANTYYVCSVTCTGSGISVGTNTVEATYFPASSCTPTWIDATYVCGYGMEVCTTGYPFTLTGSVGAINDVTACNAAGYNDETTSGITCTLNANATYTVTLGANVSAYNMADQIWIDFNSDGIFQTSESVGGYSTWTGVTETHTITIPAGGGGINPGVYRMRVETQEYYGTYPNLNPCPTATGTYYYGDVRDYKVTIAVPPVYTVTPSSLAFAPTTVGTTSATSNFAFNAAFLVPTAGTFTVTAPPCYKVYNGSSWVSSYTFTYTGATYGPTNISAQFVPTAVALFTGNITIAGGGITTASVSVTGNGAAPCSGTPTAGTATVTPTSANSSTSITMTDGGYSIAGGIAFQWNSSTDGVTYNSIYGATNSSYNFSGISQNYYFVCSVTCTNSGLSAGTSPVEVTYYPASSCTPAWYYGITTGDGYACTDNMVVCTTGYPFKIKNSGGTAIMTDATACNTNGYIDESTTGITCTMAAGSTYTANFSANINGYSMSDQVWIDFNSDGIFQTSESVGGTNTWTTTTNSSTLTIPSGASGIAPGNYRMRVEAEYYYHNYPNLSPCPDGTSADSYYEGDVRDYNITITVPPYVVATPTSIPFAPTTTGTVSASSSISLTGAYLLPAAGTFTVTAPTGFYVYDVPSGLWQATTTATYTGSTLSATSIAVEFAPTTVTTYSGSVTIAGGGITTGSVTVTGTGAAACSGMPTAGTVTISPTSGGAATAFALTDGGYTSAGGMAFQWYSSTDGSTYSSISGASNYSYNFTGIGANTYYVCSVTCTASGLTAGTNTVEATYFPASSCTPSFLYTYGCGDYMDVCTTGYPWTIKNGGTTLLSDATACVNAGYIDETTTGPTCTLAAGSSYTIKFTTNIDGYTLSDQLWIDFNGDGIFQTSESVGGNSGWSTTTSTQTITIPSAASGIVPGTYRMRAEMVDAGETLSYPNLDPCVSASDGYYGDVRDYSISITVPPYAIVSPSSIPFAPTLTSTVSATSNITLSAAYLSPATGTLTVTATPCFNVYNGSAWVSSYTIPYSGSTLSAMTIPVQFSPTAIAVFSGTVTVAGGGITTATVTTSGTGQACSGPPAAITGSSTVCNPITLLSESWESGVPATPGTAVDGWNCSGTAPCFIQSTSGANPSCSPESGSNMLEFNSYSLSAVTNYLASPSFSMSGLTGGVFTFWVYRDESAYTGTTYSTEGFTFYVNTTASPTGATTLGFVPRRANAVATSAGGYMTPLAAPGVSGWVQYTCTIPGTYTGATNYIIIKAYAELGDNCYLDNLNLTAQSGSAVTLSDATTGGLWSSSATSVATISTSGVITPLSLGSTVISYTNACGTVTQTENVLTIPATITGGAPTGVGLTETLSDAASGGTWTSSLTSIATINSSTGSLGGIGVGTTVVTYSTGCGTAKTASVIVAPACSGTPTAGTASVTPTTAGGGTSITIADGGYTLGGGIAFQWYSSLNGTTYSSISGATSASYNFTGISANTYYVCSVTCTNSAITVGTNTVLATYLLAPGCTTTAGSWFSQSITYGASAFSITGYSGSTLSDAAIQSAVNATTGYAMRYPAIPSVNLQQNGTYATSMTWGSPQGDMESQVWIDFNNDGVFQATEVVSGSTTPGWSSSTAPNPTTYNITIPFTAPTGVHLMRLRAQWDLNSTDLGHAPTNIDPCLEFFSGIAVESYAGTETDYYVNIVALPVCSGTPTGGTTAATATTGCSSGYASTLSISGSSVATGLTYQWQTSPDNVTWTPISGATNISLTTTVTATLYYDCNVTCTASGLSGASTSLLLNATQPITGLSTLCQTGTTPLGDVSTGGTWSSSATGIATVSSSGVVYGVTAGSALISYAATGCTRTYPVTVNPSPSAITGTASVCNGAVTTLADAVSGGTWSSGNTAVTTVDATGDFTGLSVGTTTVTYTNSCGSVSTAFAVNGVPGAIGGTFGMCISSTDTLTDTTASGVWSITGSATGTTIDAALGIITSSSTTGTETVYYAEGTCSVSATVNVGNASPAGVTGTFTSCTFASSTLADATTGGSWVSSNPAIASVNASSGVVTGVSAGTAVITYDAGCGTPSYSTATYTVTGSTLALSYSSGGLTGPICSGGTLQLNSGTATGGTYSWSGPGSFTSASANPTISGVTTAASGVYTFSGTFPGCGVITSTMFVAVDAVPTVAVTATPGTICTGGTSALSDVLSAPAAGSYVVNAIPYNFVPLTSPTSGPSTHNSTTAVTLPFAFTFYGTAYTGINICSNGWASFTSTSVNHTNYTLPSTSAPTSLIAFSLTDINPAVGGTISYQTVGSAPNREFLIYYNGVPGYSGSGTLTGEIILHESTNTIDMMINQYNAIPTDNSYYTFGIQNSTGTSAAVVPGRNGVSNSSKIYTAQGWRFEQPSYSYNWSPSTDLSSTSIMNPTSAGLTATQVYTVTAIDANSGCSLGNVSTATVNVVGQPSVTLTASPLTLCSGGNETLIATPTGGTGTQTYTWSGPGIATRTGTTAVPAAFTPTTATTISGMYTVSVAYTGSGCTTATGTSSVVTVNPQPHITSLTSSVSNICSGGGTITLTAPETGGTGSPMYTWKGPGLATTTSSSAPFVFTPTVAVTTSGSYSVTVTDAGGGCTTSGVVTSSSVSVYMQPTVSLTASPLTLCSGGNLTLTSVPGGGYGTPVYTWSGPGITTGTGGSASAVYTPTTSTGSYSVMLNYADPTCSVANGSSASVTVNPQPSVTVTPSATLLCIGNTETVTATPSGGSGTAAYTFAGPGITGIAGPFASAVYTVSPSAGTAAGAYTVGVSYAGSGCNTASNTTAIVTPTGQQWAGATSTSWNDATNWACGTVPTATQDVVIPASTPNAPTLDVSTGYTKKLTITGATLTLGSGNQLDIAGNLVNNGTVTGSGVLYLNGGSAQVLSGNGNVSNMTLANSAGATINSTSDTVGITGTLLLNSGTLTTNGNLMLVSNSGGSGSIGQITGGSISGNVIMQQYVPGGRRAYRFIAHPFNASIPLSQIQNYIDITGTGGSANGFTTTTSNAASAFWYNTAIGNSALGNDPGFTAYTSTNGLGSNAFNKNEGIRLYFRGAKGTGLDGSPYVVAPVTYRTWGAVNTGAQSITLVKGTGANEDYNTIGNPYPAITDIGSVINTASTGGLLTGAAFYIFNPYLGTSGQFVTETIGGSYYLGANESFQVRTTANGNTLSFAESNKGTAVTDALMRTGSKDYLTLYIYDESYHPWDLLHINFNDAATDNEDSKYDGAKAPSPASLNFYSLSADNNQLSLDSRPFNEGKVIPLGIKSSYMQDFIIKAQNVAVPDNGQVYLHDKYLQTYTQLLQGTEYKFTITKDAASQGDNRFELSMKKAGAAIAQAADGLDVQMVPNPATSVVTISYNAAAKAQTTVRVMNVEGITVLTQDLGLQQSGSTQIALDRLASGVYMVEFTSGTQKVVHRLVKE